MDASTLTLLEKPLWQMTGAEFLKLTETYSNKESIDCSNKPKVIAHGIYELSKMLDCCQSTIYEIRRSGVLEPAVISQIGRKVIFDVEKARELANSYQMERRTDKH